MSGSLTAYPGLRWGIQRYFARYRWPYPAERARLCRVEGEGRDYSCREAKHRSTLRCRAGSWRKRACCRSAAGGKARLLCRGLAARWHHCRNEHSSRGRGSKSQACADATEQGGSGKASQGRPGVGSEAERSREARRTQKRPLHPPSERPASSRRRPSSGGAAGTCYNETGDGAGAPAQAE